MVLETETVLTIAGCGRGVTFALREDKDSDDRRFSSANSPEPEGCVEAAALLSMHADAALIPVPAPLLSSSQTDSAAWLGVCCGCGTILLDGEGEAEMVLLLRGMIGDLGPRVAPELANLLLGLSVSSEAEDLWLMPAGDCAAVAAAV